MKVGKSVVLQVCGVAICSLSVSPAFAQSDNASDRAKSRLQELIEHWTPERRASAQPRDLVLDNRGLAYMKGRNGVLTPYGHDDAAVRSSVPQRGKPKVDDSTPPIITIVHPETGDTIGASATFQARVEDPESGIKSVSFQVATDVGAWQGFTPTENDGLYSVGLQGFSDGAWRWRVVAKNNGPQGGLQETSADTDFLVDTAGGGGGDGSDDSGDDVITNARWTGGPIQEAAGRIYFEMPNLRGNRIRGWSGYVCSGTLVEDDSDDNGRSVILTAAHCVYDDVAKKFARRVLFIPNQDQTDAGERTDRDCTNDPLGCWSTEFGVVDADWTTRTFPDNIPWDYAFYVVEQLGGIGYSFELDQEIAPMEISFDSPNTSDPIRTHALGYSYSDDPYFMYCAEVMGREGSFNWWLPNCGLSGGSSGGPWTQSQDPTLGTGPVMSVNSWGYQGSPGMAGPFLNGNSANCLFDTAIAAPKPDTIDVDGEAGIVVSAPCP